MTLSTPVRRLHPPGPADGSYGRVRRCGSGGGGRAYALAEHRAPPTVTVMGSPALVWYTRMVTDPELPVSLLQVSLASDAVALVSGWLEVTVTS